MEINGLRHKAIQVLYGWVVFDALFSYIFWTNNWMVEENPWVLWTLERGWVYWVGRLAILGLIVALGYLYKYTRVAKLATVAAIAIYSAIYFRFLLGVI